MKRPGPRIANLDPTGRTPAHQLGAIALPGTPDVTVRFLDMGVWAATNPDGSNRFYTVGNVVSDTGVSYVCVAAHTGHEPPNASYWEVFDNTRYVLRSDRLWSTHGPWIAIGDTGGTLGPAGPAFLNGFTVPGGGLQRLRIRTKVAGGIEPQGSVAGGGVGLVVCNLIGFIPDADIPDAEVRYASSDNSGAFVVLRFLSNGDLIFGI